MPRKNRKQNVNIKRNQKRARKHEKEKRRKQMANTGEQLSIAWVITENGHHRNRVSLFNSVICKLALVKCQFFVRWNEFYMHMISIIIITRNAIISMIIIFVHCNIVKSRSMIYVYSVCACAYAYACCVCACVRACVCVRAYAQACVSLCVHVSSVFRIQPNHLQKLLGCRYYSPTVAA